VPRFAASLTRVFHWLFTLLAFSRRDSTNMNVGVAKRTDGDICYCHGARSVQVGR
jgi:hypothetical protein